MNSNSGVILVSTRFCRYDHSLIGLEVKAKAGCSISRQTLLLGGGAPSLGSGCIPGTRVGG